MHISVLAADSANTGLDLGDLSVQIVVGVIITVIAAALIAPFVATWRRRRKPIDWAVAGAAAGQKALADWDRRIEAANHDEFVGHVFARADVLKEDVPERATGSNPVVITFRPSGRRYGFYRDHESSASSRGPRLPLRRSESQGDALVPALS